MALATWVEDRHERHAGEKDGGEDARLEVTAGLTKRRTPM
jgi:hypothetical protein